MSSSCSAEATNLTGCTERLEDCVAAASQLLMELRRKRVNSKAVRTSVVSIKVFLEEWKQLEAEDGLSLIGSLTAEAATLAKALSADVAALRQGTSWEDDLCPPAVRVQRLCNEVVRTAEAVQIPTFQEAIISSSADYPAHSPADHTLGSPVPDARSLTAWTTSSSPIGPLTPAIHALPTLPVRQLQDSTPSLSSASASSQEEIQQRDSTVGSEGWYGDDSGEDDTCAKDQDSKYNPTYMPSSVTHPEPESSLSHHPHVWGAVTPAATATDHQADLPAHVSPAGDSVTPRTHSDTPDIACSTEGEGGDAALVVGDDVTKAWAQEEEEAEEEQEEEDEPPVPPEEYLCPVSWALMSDPVVIESGQTYERSIIVNWFLMGNRSCPVTGQKVTSCCVTPNWALKRLISQWCQQNGVEQPDQEEEFDNDDSDGQHQDHPTPATADDVDISSANIDGGEDSQQFTQGLSSDTGLAADNATGQVSAVGVNVISPSVPTCPPPGAILAAAEEHNLPALRRLIAAGGDVSEQDRQGQTALHFASVHNSKPMIECLLAAGASTSTRNMYSLTPLMTAVLTHKNEAVETLLQNGASVFATCGSRGMPLHGAAAEGNLIALSLLLRWYAPLEACDENGNTPLALACKNRQSGAVRILLDSGACTETPNYSNYTPLYHAIVTNHLSIVHMLLDAGASGVCCVPPDTLHALHVAASEGLTDVTDILLSHPRFSQEVHRFDHFSLRLGSEMFPLWVVGTPLHAAACNGFVGTVQLLLQQGAVVDAHNRSHRMARGTTTPLMCASLFGHKEVAEALLAAGADPCFRDRFGYTALHSAVENGHEEVVALLLEHGAKVCATPPNGVPQNDNDASSLPEFNDAAEGLPAPVSLEWTNVMAGIHDSSALAVASQGRDMWVGSGGDQGEENVDGAAVVTATAVAQLAQELLGIVHPELAGAMHISDVCRTHEQAATSVCEDEDVFVWPALQPGDVAGGVGDSAPADAASLHGMEDEDCAQAGVGSDDGTIQAGCGDGDDIQARGGSDDIIQARGSNDDNIQTGAGNDDTIQAGGSNDNNIPPGADDDDIIQAGGYDHDNSQTWAGDDYVIQGGGSNDNNGRIGAGNDDIIQAGEDNDDVVHAAACTNGMIHVAGSSDDISHAQDGNDDIIHAANRSDDAIHPSVAAASEVPSPLLDDLSVQLASPRWAAGALHAGAALQGGESGVASGQDGGRSEDATEVQLQDVPTACTAGEVEDILAKCTAAAESAAGAYATSMEWNDLEDQQGGPQVSDKQSSAATAAAAVVAAAADGADCVSVSDGWNDLEDQQGSLNLLNVIEAPSAAAAATAVDCVDCVNVSDAWNHLEDQQGSLNFSSTIEPPSSAAAAAVDATDKLTSHIMAEEAAGQAVTATAVEVSAAHGPPGGRYAAPEWCSDEEDQGVDDSPDSISQHHGSAVGHTPTTASCHATTGDPNDEGNSASLPSSELPHVRIVADITTITTSRSSEAIQGQEQAQVSGHPQQPDTALSASSSDDEFILLPPPPPASPSRPSTWPGWGSAGAALCDTSPSLDNMAVGSSHGNSTGPCSSASSLPPPPNPTQNAMTSSPSVGGGDSGNRAADADAGAEDGDGAGANTAASGPSSQEGTSGRDSNHRYCSVLGVAAGKGNSKMVRLLLKAGAPPDDFTPDSGLTPLHMACEADRRLQGSCAEVVKLLLQEGADPNAPAEPPGLGFRGRSRRPHAVGSGDIISGTVQTQAEKSPWPLISPLQRAIRTGALEVIEVLLDGGAHLPPQVLHDLICPNPPGAGSGRRWGRAYRPVGHRQDLGDLAHLLLRRGADVNYRNGAGRTPLLAAAWACAPDSCGHLIQVLLSQGADVLTRDTEGLSALDYATLCVNDKAAALLIAAGARPSINAAFSSLLLLCVTDTYSRPMGEGDEDDASNGGYPSMGVNLDGGFAEEKARSCRAARLAEVLLEEDVEFQLQQRAPGLGFTAIHAAAAGNNLILVRTLVLHGADVNAQDKHGNTPLHYAAAVCRGCNRMVQVLMELGGDPHLTNSRGLRPMHLLLASCIGAAALETAVKPDGSNTAAANKGPVWLVSDLKAYLLLGGTTDTFQAAVELHKSFRGLGLTLKDEFGIVPSFWFWGRRKRYRNSRRGSTWLDYDDSLDWGDEPVTPVKFAGTPGSLLSEFRTVTSLTSWTLMGLNSYAACLTAAQPWASTHVLPA